MPTIQRQPLERSVGEAPCDRDTLTKHVRTPLRVEPATARYGIRVSTPERLLGAAMRVKPLIIVLPWPKGVLHPNARVMWPIAAAAKRGARARARHITEEALLGNRVQKRERLTVALTFEPPDRRKRDLDGCLSSVKAYLDGIADACGVDDSGFTLALSMGAVCDGGRVTVRIT